MEITFLGAAGTVTGSRHLVRAGGRTVLVDCGLFQGLKRLRLRNREPFPVPPGGIDAVVLTHAHLDHSGYLPVLVRDGFAGTAHCTPGTRDLCGVLHPDSGHLQEEEAGYANRRGFSRHRPAEPLYTRADAERSLDVLRATPFGGTVELGGGLRCDFLPAGHILGAAMVRLTDGTTTVLFTGDLGRPDDPLLPEPARVARADWIVCESTYGDRTHPRIDPADRLAEVVVRTAARGGSVLIPSFAVGRAQSILFLLHRLRREGRIPQIPVYLDSPMASAATGIFVRSREHRLTPAEARAVAGVATATERVEQSIAVDRMRVPRVVVSASGMMTGGRVLHHLKVFGPDPRCTILLTGHQAEGTRGARLVAGERRIKVHGAYLPVRAEVAVLDNLSAHADREEIVGWMRGFEAPPRGVLVVHGEPAASDALRLTIEERLGWDAAAPAHGDVADLSAATADEALVAGTSGQGPVASVAAD